MGRENVTSHETAGSLRLSMGTVRKCHASGLIDVQDTEGRIFAEINCVSNGVDTQPALDDRVIVLNDGARKFVVGSFRDPVKDPITGKITIKNTDDDLADLRNTQSLIVSDGIGGKTRVVVSVGGGVLLDGGKLALVHIGSEGTIQEFFQRKDSFSPGVTSSLDHDDVSCSAETLLRTTFDKDALDREAKEERDLTLDLGNTINMSFKKDEGVKIVHRKDGLVLWNLSADEDGILNIQHSQEISDDHDFEHPALAKMVHRFVMEAVEHVYGRMQMVSDFGRPMTFKNDVVFGEGKTNPDEPDFINNEEIRVELTNSFTFLGDNETDIARENDTILSLTKVKIKDDT